MSFHKSLFRFSLVPMLALFLGLSGCSYIPWIGDEENEEDLAFEQDFGDPNESEFEDVPASASAEEDDFFADEAPQEESFDDAGGVEDSFDDPGDGFSSVDQPTRKNELRTDVETLQAQQEALISRVRELQEIIQAMEPRLAATQDQLETRMGSVSGEAGGIKPEMDALKAEVSRLNSEISRLKTQEGHMKTASTRTTRRTATRSSKGLPPAYNKALAAYQSGNYDDSIYRFQELSQKSPPNHLKDNIHFWIGNNYFKLEMYDDAITQFQSVISNYPTGNKIHDSRYMLGVSLFKKGDTGRALDVLEAALKGNPPAETRDKIQKQLMEIK